VEDSLADVKTEGGKATVQREVDWAKDLLFFEAPGQGAKMHVPIDIPEAGRYELVAQIAQAPDYGDYIALLDGQQTNLDTRQAATSEIPFPGPEVFHNYLPEVYVAKDRPLGLFELTKGRHILTFVCMGRDPHSAGYNFGIQELVLERVPQPEPRSPSSEAKGPVTGAGRIVYRGRPLSYYIAQLQNSSPEDRASVLRAIGNFGLDGATAVALLADALSDESPDVRGAAAGALAEVGPPAASRVPGLAKLLADSAPRVRSVAAVALKNMGTASAPALPQLVAALDDPVDYVRAAAADALGAIGPSARAAVLPLIQRLAAQHESNFVFDSVIYALGDIGPAAAAAIPALQEMARRPRLAYPAEQAILEIEGKPVPTYH
jgi:HEAT repeats